MSHKSKLQLLLAGTLITAAAPALSFAASSGASSVTFAPKRGVSYSAPIIELSDTDPAIKSRVLNWNQPSITLTFDLSEADIIDDLELLLTADPIGPVSKQTPISVQFNNDKPTRIVTRGQGFDSRIRLNPRRVRSKNNTITITYETPRGADCVTQQDGAWLVDLRHSKLVVKGRAKNRSLQLREVEMRLDLPAMAPRRVGLIAKGSNATALQALAAQGIGLRMDSIPNFTTQKGAGDFEVIMVRRDELHAYTKDTAILDSEGPRVYVPRGRPMRLFITGDTDAQILETVKSFATHKLPNSRRQLTSLGEMNMQFRLGGDVAQIDRKTKLSALPGFQYGTSWKDEDWASRPQALRFSVADPAATSGEVVLKLSGGENLTNDSKLRVALNGELLGSAAINTTRQTATFPIRPGTLHGADNVLTLRPELKTSEGSQCYGSGNMSTEFHIGNGSAIILNTHTPSPITDLSRMAATGAPFSDDFGRESYIALPKGSANFNASLKVLARLAKVSRKGLTEAAYDRSASLAEAGDRHVLMINDRSALGQDIRSLAPTAFTQALKGRAISGDNLASTAYNQYADAEGMIAFRSAAKAHAKLSRVNAGGVASLFGSNAHTGRVIGVFSNTPGQSFALTADQIAISEHWNELEGGVARWNSKSVLLAQTATDIAGYKPPASAVMLPELPSLSDLIADFEIPSTDRIKEFGVTALNSVQTRVSALFAGKETTPKTQHTARTKTPVYDELPSSQSSAFIDKYMPKTRAKAVPRNAGYTGKPLIPQTANTSLPALRGPIPVAPMTLDWKENARMKVGAVKDWFSQKSTALRNSLQPAATTIKQAFSSDKASSLNDITIGGKPVNPQALVLMLGLMVFLFMTALMSLLLGKGRRR